MINKYSFSDEKIGAKLMQVIRKSTCTTKLIPIHIKTTCRGKETTKFEGIIHVDLDAALFYFRDRSTDYRTRVSTPAKKYHKILKELP